MCEELETPKTAILEEKIDENSAWSPVACRIQALDFACRLEINRSDTLALISSASRILKFIANGEG